MHFGLLKNIVAQADLGGAGGVQRTEGEFTLLDGQVPMRKTDRGNCIQYPNQQRHGLDARPATCPF